MHTHAHELQVKALVEMENTGLLALLRLDKYEDLHRMYMLFRRVDGGLATVRSMMANTVKEDGRALVMVRAVHAQACGGGALGFLCASGVQTRAACLLMYFSQMAGI